MGEMPPIAYYPPENTALLQAILHVAVKKQEIPVLLQFFPCVTS
jgi:hypothetical protein